MNLKDSILSLSALMSISGNEKVASQALEGLLGDVFDQHMVDPVGNHVFVKKCGRENAPKILIDAHFDEIGMMVTGIKEGGFVTMTNIGGVDNRILQGGEVIIYGKQEIYGVITSTPPHFRSGDSDKLQPMDALYIDTGYTKETLEELVSLGTPIGLKPIYGEMQNNRIFGKAFDDKACGACAICGLADVAVEDLAGDVYFLFSAQEEVGCRGAVLAAFGISPDYCMIIDVTHAAVPEVSDRYLPDMDSGITIGLAVVTDRKLTRMVVDMCVSQNIPHTTRACPGNTGTNANKLGICAEGIPTVLCSLPIKNMHSATEVLSLHDAKALADVVAAFVTSKTIGEVFAQ